MSKTIDEIKEELNNALCDHVDDFTNIIQNIFPEDTGNISDGYHTFNSLYHQRMVLFAALVNTFPDYSWKSKRHYTGELCFGGDWFIVGIDTPKGQYTYHYKLKDWDKFRCRALSKGKKWDGHTENDVERLLSL